MGDGIVSRARRRVRMASLTALWLCLAVTGPAPALAQAQEEDKALGRPASASSVEAPGTGSCRACPPGNATDGRADTRWGSAFSGREHWQVDLGRPRLVDAVTVDWQWSYATRYEVATSLDGVTFAPAAAVGLAPGLRRAHVVQRTAFGVRLARFVRITGLEREFVQWGFSIWTASVFGPPDPAEVPPDPPAAPDPGPPPPAASQPPAPSPAVAAGSAAAPGTPTPPRGAPALRPMRTAIVRLRGAATSRGATITLLSVRAPKAATVRVRCTGRGCPKRIRARRGSGRIPELRRTLAAGAVVEVFVTQPGTSGKYTRFQIRRRQAPRRTDSCIVAGAPAACPAG